MDVDTDSRRSALRRSAPAPVILLDTNALIWLEQGHKRMRAHGSATRLYISPANLLELQFLLEAGRIRLRGTTVADLARSERWVLDDPPAVSWFSKALDVGWTRDPFDRLLVAHARLRGWRLATRDSGLREHLPDTECIDV